MAMSRPVTSATNTAKCYLLSKDFPAELRNAIYELVFTPEEAEQDEDGMIRLWTAQGPAADFLLSCRQIYDEAYGFFKHVTRQFWQKTEFSLDLPEIVTLHSWTPEVVPTDPSDDYYDPDGASENTTDINTISEYLHRKMYASPYSLSPPTGGPYWAPRWELVKHITSKGFQNGKVRWEYDDGMWMKRMMNTNETRLFVVIMEERPRMSTFVLQDNQVKVGRKLLKGYLKTHIMSQLSCLAASHLLSLR